MTSHSAETAVLVIDMHNGTVHEDGAYALTGAAERARVQDLAAELAG